MLPLIHQHYSIVSILENVLGCFVLAVDYGLVAFTVAKTVSGRGRTLHLVSVVLCVRELLA